MTLLHPVFLWLLIPLALFALVRYHQYHLDTLPFRSEIVLENRRTPLMRLAPFIALAWMILSLARPVVTESRDITAPSPQTVYLAIDASRSMQARDRVPDRYEFAKTAIEKLLSIDNSHRFALITFTSNALILSPPTSDRELIHVALESFNPDYILTHGTSLDALIRYVARFGGNEQKRLVVFSDGGDGEYDASLVAFVRSHRIRIYGVACATRNGAKIPVDEGWLHDKEGHLVISMQNPALERLSIESGGETVDEKMPEVVAATLAERLEDPITSTASERVQYHEFFWIPLLLGILFFLVGTLSLSGLKRMLRLPLVLLFGLHLQASILDIYRLHRGYEAYKTKKYREAEAIFREISYLQEGRYALANTLYREGAYKKAGRLFASIKAKKPAVKRQVWYNLGNCAAKMGHYKSAADYYIKALQLGYDPDAVHNLQLVLFLQEKMVRQIAPKANRHVKAVSRSGTADQSEKSGTKKGGNSRMQQGSGSDAASKTTVVGRRPSAQAASKRHPLGSRVYEMINKGYINEKKPW
ncbi:VWA domain-containing protein [Hydrogenimonas cancrithermarum]|uniref:VWFA domain-containing protein n=1 Tax=Hydrogenimonas cancrithermarum TaxID=2993563 RepID=A0ABM8FN80_9BACT|nr:VWA domain-containing protein [Hydrogenimonas cancrithermarum]BDY13817.1 hypothetical protein HCR_21290 [Hydrogenimonas cancrithermarum]